MMNDVLQMFSQYGILIIFVLIFLEHLNTPGLAAGILLGGVGIIAKRGDVNIITAIVVCLLAAFLANVILYIVGRYMGGKIIDILVKKFPKSETSILKAKKMSNNSYGRISTRFIPVVRTIMPLIEGGIGVKFIDFAKTSVIGVFGYNSSIIVGGYFLGNIFG